MLHDLTHAARMLLQSKGWTAVVLISLALGIGANTALFSAVNGLLLQTVAVPNPETLVRLKWSGQNDMVRSSSEYGFSRQFEGKNVRATVSYSVFQELRKANQTLTGLFACAPIGGFNVVLNGEAEIGSALGASGNYFQVLGVPAFLGRMFNEEDDKPSAAPVAVISYSYWRRRFASDPNVAGKVVSMNNQQVTIVGVTPELFQGIQRLAVQGHDITVPISFDPVFNVGQKRISEPTNWWVQVLGRLKPGVTYEQVRGNLDGVFQNTARAGMESYMSGLTAEQRGLSTNQRRGTEAPRLLVSSGERGVYDVDENQLTSARVLGGVVLAVLLIVCANVANLLLSRATSRRKEISVRLSMGATRGRLVRQLLTESLLLSVIGGLLGIAVGYWSRGLLPFGQTVPLDWRVFGFVAGLSMLTGVLFGLAPAFRATRVDLASVMKEESRSVVGGKNYLARGLLVVEVGLSLVLLVGAALFLKTLQNLRAVDVGFNPNNLLMFNVNPALNRYEGDRIAQLFTQMQERLNAVPGVRSTALTRVMVLSGSTSTSSVHIPERPGSNDIYMMSVSAEFFDTLEIPRLAGRGFAVADTSTSPKVAIINETAAKKLFPNESAVGRRIGFSPEKNTEYEIVGVTRDTKYNSLREPAPPTFYQLYTQTTARSMAFVVRTAGDPAAMTESVRTAIRQVDPTLPLTNISTQTDQIERRFAQQQLFANACSLFGGLALLLAAIGLFGLMSYNVSRRTNEIGIRMALGAQRSNVIRLMLRESLVLVAIGVVLGLTTAFVVSRFVTAQLFGLSPMDATAISVAIVLMLAVSALACYLPARRASRVDPMIALHQQ
jgi:predicted permease